MLKSFLVDLENVSWNIFDDILDYNLDNNDYIYIFHNADMASCPSRIIANLSRVKARIKIIPVVRGGKNSLDFQLACFLGGIAKNNLNREYIIISKDMGFKVLQDFLYPVKVRLVSSFQKAFSLGIDKLTKKEVLVLKRDIEEKLRNNQVLEFKDYRAITGIIVSSLGLSKDMSEFINRLKVKIKNKDYVSEIIKICEEYIN